jgi:hypothetical protein
MAQEGCLSCGSIGSLCNTSIANIGCERKHARIIEKEAFMGFLGNGFTVAGN